MSRRRWESTVLFTSSSLMRLTPFVGPEALCLEAPGSMTLWSTSFLLRCEPTSYLTKAVVLENHFASCDLGWEGPISKREVVMSSSK